MNKRYWWILITYVLMQLSGFVGVPILQQVIDTDDPILIFGTWSLISFSAGTIIILLLSRPTPDDLFARSERMTGSKAVVWSIYGVLIAFFAQSLASMIEMYVLGIEPQSENTEALLNIARSFPLFIILTSILGPIMEEIVFRKVLFGTFYKRLNFFFSALLSSVIFAFVHNDPAHLLVYTAIGFTFAYLYVRTKRIIVPIAAHVAMNSFVVITQLLIDEEDIMKQLEQMQQFIGGF